MSGPSDASYKKALGARILSEANDLKRTPEALALELNLSQGVVKDVIAGEATIKTTRRVIEAMAESYPIAFSDLWMEPDDTDDGVVIMRAEASSSTSRVFDRKDRDGAAAPYYEYRDTAMSRTGPFKPEWIKELRVVDNADPRNPDVVYNNGHLLHQQTFIIGEVNFYWLLDGEPQCAELNTGDSNYITPFVPHSFTSRNPDTPGLIVAVTFGGQVRRALAEFARIDGATADSLSGDLRSHQSGYRARLVRHLANESMTATELTRRLVALDVAEDRATELAGGAIAVADELPLVASSLNIRLADLLVSILKPDEEVVVQRARDSVARPWPESNAVDCRVTELARTKHQPSLKGFMVEVLGNQGSNAPFQHSLFEYVYNYGDEPVSIGWADGREDHLKPGDSACISPMIAHWFVRPEGAGEGRLCVVRVPGALGETAIDEYAAFASEGRRRVIGETKQWF